MDSFRVTGLVALVITHLSFTSLALAADEPTPVRAVTLSSLVIQPVMSAPAQVLSLNDSRIESPIAATVEQIRVRVGDVVEAGAELLSLECGDQRNIVEQNVAGRDALRARLAFADFQYTRALSLVKSKNISDEQLRQRKADAAAKLLDNVGLRRATDT
jgi:multidrug efflux pump subunit AcrA (membrane-fusion protein)